MRNDFSTFLQSALAAYVNVRIFMATFLLTVMVCGLWYVDRITHDHLYCKEGQECHVLSIVYGNPFGKDYLAREDYGRMPYKIATLYDEDKRRKIGSTYFEEQGDILRAYFEVPTGNFKLAVDNSNFSAQQIFVDKDTVITLPRLDPLEKSNMWYDNLPEDL